MKISKRLETVARLVPEGMSVADVGTDHGYVPIYLAQNGISSRIIAMDVNRGPLTKAEDNIRANMVGDKITTRLSDGLAGLGEGEADCIIIAGMGGPLICKIIKTQINKAKKAKKLLLSPQSELDEVRLFLSQNGFCINDEVMVKEDGKFYIIMDVCAGVSAEYSTMELLFGRYLIQRRDEYMRQYLLRERRLAGRVLEKLKNTGMCDTARYAEVIHNLENIDRGLNEYDN